MLLMRVAFARASLVIANSNYTAQLLADCGVRKHTFVIPLGVAAKPYSSHGAQQIQQFFPLVALCPGKDLIEFCSQCRA